VQRLADARLEQHLRGLDVVRRVHLEVAPPALAHARLGSQVEHVGDTIEEPIETGTFDSRFDERKSRPRRERLQVRLFDRPRVIVGEAVDPGHFEPAIEQLAGEVGRDEACRARDQGLHAKSSLTRDGRRDGRPWAFTAACSVRPRTINSLPGFRAIS
jgi:hypothetical protein